MKYQITEHTTDYRGTHHAAVEIAHEAIDGETAEDMINRVLGLRTSAQRQHDYITIRLTKLIEEQPQP